MEIGRKIGILILNLCFGILTAGIWIGVIIWHWIDLIDKENEDER